MEKYFENAYRGDPGVPHCDPNGFTSIWVGSALFSVLSWNHPYFWTHASQHNWHDQAMLYEHNHWKKAFEKGKRYKFLWNQRNRKWRDTYYFNWPIYFK